MSRIVDLSQEIYTGMMVYPGHLKTVLFDHASHAETAPRFDSGFSFQTKGFLMNDNGPTHVDSFSHLDPDVPGAAGGDRGRAAGHGLRARAAQLRHRGAADRFDQGDVGVDRKMVPVILERSHRHHRHECGGCR